MPTVEELAKGAAEGILTPLTKAIQIFKADATQGAQLDAALEQTRLGVISTTISAVNATMQAESKSEHWMQWAWRPTVGFTFSATILNNFILYSYFAKYGMQQITIPSEVWNAMLVILGVAAATRGWEKASK